MKDIDIINQARREWASKGRVRGVYVSNAPHEAVVLHLDQREEDQNWSCTVFLSMKPVAFRPVAFRFGSDRKQVVGDAVAEANLCIRDNLQLIRWLSECGSAAAEDK